MVKQRIDGNNNVQVGHVDGNLTISPDDPLDSSNPNLIQCPSCWKLASRWARPCPRCGYDIAGHFAALEREERRTRAMWVAGVCTVVFVLGGVLMGTSWFPESLRGALTVVTFAAMLGPGHLLQWQTSSNDAVEA